MASIAAAPETLSYAEARARVLVAAAPLPPETVPLVEARGRALRRTVIASHDLPPFRNSSMDGVAVRAGDLASARPEAPVRLRVVEVIPAGSVASRPLAPREAMRIMTGAMVPEGADAVVPVEDLEARGDDVWVRRAAAAGDNIREAGRDLARGDAVLAEGRELSVHDLALLGALGVGEVLVGRRPQATVLSTGDELLDVKEALTPGAIRDSNLPMLAMLLEECGARVVRVARVKDDPAAVVEQVRRALEVSDVVLTIGGVSAGEFDPVKQGLDEIGDVALWRVAMKPGRPQAFGKPGGRLFFGLPGNPASVACVFEALVRPALRRLQGYASLDRPRITVRAAEPIGSRTGRTDFVRVSLTWREGAFWATPCGEQVSGHLTPQSRAHALLVVPEDAMRLETAAEAEALILRWPDPPAA